MYQTFEDKYMLQLSVEKISSIILSFLSYTFILILGLISSGISSLAFTRYGEALYLHSSSELQRISVSASSITQVDCSLNLPSRDRPTNSRSITPINGYTDDEQDDLPKVNGLYLIK